MVYKTLRAPKRFSLNKRSLEKEKNTEIDYSFVSGICYNNCFQCGMGSQENVVKTRRT